MNKLKAQSSKLKRNPKWQMAEAAGPWRLELFLSFELWILSLAGTIRVKWGAHASRVRCSASRGTHRRVGELHRLVLPRALGPTGETPVGTREDACAPREEVNRSGLERDVRHLFAF
jgi:hypothetical protein